jgi:predicted O-methyltransferase YrrM
MGLRKTIRQLVRKLGYDIVRLEHTHLAIPERFPPGHFYSVIPSLSEVTERASAIFSKTVGVSAIELNIEEQIQTLKDFKTMEEQPPFYSQERRKRFTIENDSFSYDDAPILHYMMRRLHPKRIIEIGSGNSSACMLDTSEIYLGDSVDFTFIDLNCENLRKNLLQKDLLRIQILEQPVQDVDKTIFTTLQANDLLFVDSSHVMKAGSDLCTILFEVLPILSPGVCVHFHDIRYPLPRRRGDERNLLERSVYAQSLSNEQ